jgi:hypothetical protein
MALGPEYYEYEPADLSDDDELQILMELETDPEDIPDLEERKRYTAFLATHKKDPDA